jgi:hypothetical protein
MGYDLTQKFTFFVFWHRKWYFGTKIVLISRKTLEFKAEGREFAKFLGSLEQFIQTVKGQYNFWNRMLSSLVPGGFSDLIY